MKKSLLVALTAFTALSAFHAQAQERWPRWYLGVSGGYTFMSDQDVSGGSAGATKLEANGGYGVSGAIGYFPSSSMPLLNQLRFEAEVAYHDNDVDKVHLNTGAKINGNGSISSTAYMFNTFYDFATQSQWTPYIGAGVGMATVHLSANSGVGNGDSSDTTFAYQGLAGIGYSPTSLPNTQWLVGYRYLGTSDAKLGGTTVEYSTHSIEAGAHFRF